MSLEGGCLPSAVGKQPSDLFNVSCSILTIYIHTMCMEC